MLFFIIMKSFYQNCGKRIFDIIFSLIVLSFTWPLLIIISLLIKLFTFGPIIFKQKRVGKNGKVFTFYKFRTMVKNAEKLKKKYLSLNEANGPVFKIKNDPRFINSFTKFIARSGLDELANIINVLKGDISWVGPRPLPVNEAKKINPKIRKIRESVLPGITSLWVISGAHSLSFRNWMKLDQRYVKNINFIYDLKIIKETAKMTLLFIIP